MKQYLSSKTTINLKQKEYVFTTGILFKVGREQTQNPNIIVSTCFLNVIYDSYNFSNINLFSKRIFMIYGRRKMYIDDDIHF